MGTWAQGARRAASKAFVMVEPSYLTWGRKLSRGHRRRTLWRNNS